MLGRDKKFIVIDLKPSVYEEKNRSINQEYLFVRIL
jgi:hypothetical protein